MERTSWEHLRDELELLNACLLREVRRRTQKNSELDLLQGFVLSEQEVIEILTNPPATSPSVNVDEDSERLNELRERISKRRDNGVPRTTSQLKQITTLFQLERIEEQCLILCLAPEINSRYAKVFAFLQDDVTKRQPSTDLALKLFCEDIEESTAARALFSAGSALFRNRLLHFGQPSDKQLAFPHRSLKLDDRIASFLLQTPQLDESLINWVEALPPASQPTAVSVPGEILERTIRLVESSFSGGGAFVRPLFHLRGRPGSGRRALAAAVCHCVGLPLLVADLRRMPVGETPEVETLWRLCRESLLLPAVLLVEHFDELLQEGRSRELAALLDAVHYFSPATFLSGTRNWRPDSHKSVFINLECPVPDATSRMHFWREELRDNPNEFQESDLVELASKFNFTGGQIHHTVQAARHRAYWESQSPLALTPTLISDTGRSISTPTMSGLARKVDSRYSWSDIVLPENQLVQLQEIALHAKRAQVVFEKWDFAKNFSYGKGIAALFAGQSGTGKTMAASIVGHELGLDLYQIDLSCVVSKYIGETEKNLSRIFAEAQDSNAILFFDEADALFGKRSEVKDAHDRYANIETAYLLQRMEEYCGIVILATNMKQNIDEAFVRRMRFIIHFPFPCDEDRERIWHKAFPATAPLGNDVNFRWLSRKLKITGGNIKNISLRAAFLAIEREGVINMDCLIEAAKRENEKIGKIAGLADFRGRGSFDETVEVAEVA